MRDPYEVLGVSGNASQDDIRSAYRAASREAHPDIGGDEARQRELNEAYEAIGDEESRAEFDRTGESGGEARTARDASARLEQALASAVRRVMSSPAPDLRVLHAAATDLRSSVDHASLELRKADAMIGRLRSKRDTVVRKTDGPNVFAALVDSTIGDLEHGKAEIGRQLRALERALEMLETDYDEAGGVRPPTGEFRLQFRMDDTLKRLVGGETT